MSAKKDFGFAVTTECTWDYSLTCDCNPPATEKTCVWYQREYLWTDTQSRTMTYSLCMGRKVGEWSASQHNDMLIGSINDDQYVQYGCSTGKYCN